MKGVFIKGMPMPDGCEKCVFMEANACGVTGQSADWTNDIRPDWVPDNWVFAGCPLVELEGSFTDKDEASDLIQRLRNASEMMIYSEGVRDYFKEAADMIERLVLRVEFAEDHLTKAATRLHHANVLLQSAFAELPEEE